MITSSPCITSCSHLSLAQTLQTYRGFNSNQKTPVSGREDPCIQDSREDPCFQERRPLYPGEKTPVSERKDDPCIQERRPLCPREKTPVYRREDPWVRERSPLGLVEKTPETTLHCSHRSTMGININNMTAAVSGTNRTFLENGTEELETCFVPENAEWVFTYQPIYMWFIFVLGFIENLFVILVFILHKSRCTVAEVYLGNMAAADLIFISGLPFWAVSLSNRFYWPFGGFMCVTVNSLIQLNYYSSIYFLMMVSIDRYLALVKTMSVGRMRRPWCAKINCVIIWIFALAVSLPKVVFRKVTFVPALNATSCIIFPPFDSWHVATNIITNLVGFLIPFVVIAFCTSQIIGVLRNNVMQQFKEIKNEKKATWLVLSVLLVFVICWLPFQVFTFIDTFYLLEVFENCAIIEIGNQISSYIAYSNSCINPLLYVMVGNHFRKKAKEVYQQLVTRIKFPKNEPMPMNYSGVTVRTSISMGQQNLIKR
ncbi:B2 bradykinin receptor-like isoform X2 [Ranitomeya variabilis]|uniref:B2 bradykinin receptor-like isoform X2 n=1 Tax=Ranitomeya variabilis TaxID=490064 RepID=UPI0040564433